MAIVAITSIDEPSARSYVEAVSTYAQARLIFPRDSSSLLDKPLEGVGGLIVTESSNVQRMDLRVITLDVPPQEMMTSNVEAINPIVRSTNLPLPDLNTRFTPSFGMVPPFDLLGGLAYGGYAVSV